MKYYFHKKCLTLSLVSFIFLMTTGNHAEASEWVRTNGPSGAPMDSIVIHPTNRNVLYACGPGGGVYKTTNSGQTWILKEIEGVHPSDPLHSLIIDPVAHDTLYVAGSGGIWKTTNGGNSWQAKISGINTCHANIKSLVLDPKDRKSLYAGTYSDCHDTLPGAIYKSNNGGDLWTEITNNINMPSDGEVTALDAIDSQIYVGVYDDQTWKEGRLYYSSNDGETWTEVDFGKPADTYIYSVFFNPGNPDEVWVGLNSVYNIALNTALFLTEDGGLNWRAIPNFPDPGEVIILGTSSSGLLHVNGYRTADKGETWQTYFENDQREVTDSPIGIRWINCHDVYVSKIKVLIDLFPAGTTS